MVRSYYFVDKHTSRNSPCVWHVKKFDEKIGVFVMAECPYEAWANEVAVAMNFRVDNEYVLTPSTPSKTG